MVDVALRWHKITWRPGEFWAKITLPRLNEYGLTRADLSSSVYVIRLSGEYCIRYPKGHSPTIYIAEGVFPFRIHSHRSWILELKDLVKDFPVQIRKIAVPSVKNCTLTHRDCEAALLLRFRDKFGSTPLWNKQFVKRLCLSYRYNLRQMDRAICIGKSTKYKWELRPMKASHFYDVYNQPRDMRCLQSMGL